MTGIFLFLKHVADLLDRCYEREALLHANHIHSFAPALRFAEQFASADELAAHRTFKRDRFKSDLWPDPDFDEWFLKARDEAERRRMKTGNIWEGEMDPFRERYTKMLVQARSELLRMRQPYEEDRDELFREEVDRFSTDLSQSEEWADQKRSAFCKAVFAVLEPAAGLWLDRKLSTKVSPVFSKNLAQDWKASLHIDGAHLNSPYRRPSIDPTSGRPERRVHPSVDVWLNIRPLKPREDESRKRAGLMFDWLFPIGHEGCIGGHGPFASLRELEAILRIYIEMFRLIEPELEAALVRESADRGA
jgi:hypothetical protein